MEVVPMFSVHRDSINVHELLKCYNVSKEEKDEEDPKNMKKTQTEGEPAVEGPKLEYVAYAQPLKT